MAKDIRHAVCDHLGLVKCFKKDARQTLQTVGWGTDQRGFGEEPGMKTQILTLIRSIRTVMRIPLIAINIVVIGLKLLLG